jgi:acetyltransferase
LIETAKRYKINILGPNCLGIINPYTDLNSTFVSIPVKKGDIAFISQSGALCSAVLDISLKENLGFSFFASVGNMSDIDFSDLIEYLDNDKNTKVIILYIEALKPNSGRNFIEVSKKCSKPIIVLKAGISQAGAKTALTHTGSLASGYEIYKEAFKEAGIIEAKSLTNALDKALFYSKNKYDLKKGTVILSNAGGPAVLAADYCDEFNIKLAEMPGNIINSLNKVLPSTWNKSNPIDIIGDADADRYKKALDNLNFDYGCLICILTPQEMSKPLETARALVEFNKKTKKPVIAAFLGGKRVSTASKLLNKSNILCFQELRRSVKVLSI